MSSIQMTTSQAYPIYILLTHPRATATAFEKVMRTKKQLRVFHAPFNNPYLINKYGPNHELTRKIPNKNETFDDVKSRLFEEAKTSCVFLKESAYLLQDYIKEHPDFYKDPQVKFAFLVRDPARSILSYYKEKPDVDESIIGHEQLWELHKFLSVELDTTPLIIDSDEWLKHPLSVLNKLGEDWNLTFTQKNLVWEAKLEKDHEFAKAWYEEVSKSTGLRGCPEDVIREKEGTIPVYREVANKVDRKRLQDIFRAQNPYYKKLLAYAIKC